MAIRAEYSTNSEPFVEIQQVPKEEKKKIKFRPMTAWLLRFG